MKLGRLFRHLLTPSWVLNRTFTPEVLDRIAQSISESEGHHRGEIRVAVEAGLDLGDLWRGIRTRQRAEEVFSRLRVWDTEENTGVLIYIQWVDRQVEIVADRGIAARVSQSAWESICRALESQFKAQCYLEGSVEAVQAIGTLLTTHFPPGPHNPNELPDRPILLP